MERCQTEATLDDERAAGFGGRAKAFDPPVGDDCAAEGEENKLDKAGNGAEELVCLASDELDDDEARRHVSVRGQACESLALDAGHNEAAHDGAAPGCNRGETPLVEVRGILGQKLVDELRGCPQAVERV